MIHVLTEKGRGYPRAEQAPELFHGLGAFDPASGKALKDAAATEPGPTFSHCFGQALCRLWAAQGHELVVWSRRPEQVAALCSGARSR